MEDPTIMVYDVMPSQQQHHQFMECHQHQPNQSTAKRSKPNLMDRIYRKSNELFLSQEKMLEQQIYSISSSSNNSMSPVTTSTIDTSKKDKQQREPLSEESDSKRTDKDIVYEWFLQTLTTESNSKEVSEQRCVIAITNG